jgi:NAD(P)-dependent dehydrogenase (short-subunit alcohol dehydrogenase family)
MDPRDLLENLLEITVVGSFASPGYRWRRALYGWDDPSSWPMAGRTVVITGPTSGLGREAAASLASMGARLVLVGRDPHKLEQVRAALAEVEGGGHVPVVADMASLASVRAASEAILEAAPRIDALIDNAGTMMPTREVTLEGHERTFATMVLGPFVLTARLLPALSAAPAARIVAVTSGGMYAQSLPLDDLEYEHGDYDGTRAYARAKRAQVALVREWARRLAPRGITANAMHPGWADTPGLEAALPGFRRLVGPWLRTAAEGVDSILWLAASPEASGMTGRLVLDRRARPFDRVPSTRLIADDRRNLWDRVVAMTGEGDPG